MNREQLAHIIRAAATIADDGDIVIIGSQAILGVSGVASLPDRVTMSMEADVAFLSDVDAVKADKVDGAIGELSQFHATFQYYAQGVEIGTAVLPTGWQGRAEKIDWPDSHPGTARCLEAHDLVVSKLVAGRQKDIDFATALIAHDFVQVPTLLDRAGMLDRPNAVIERVRRLVTRCAAGSPK